MLAPYFAPFVAHRVSVSDQSAARRDRTCALLWRPPFHWTLIFFLLDHVPFFFPAFYLHTFIIILNPATLNLPSLPRKTQVSGLFTTQLSEILSMYETVNLTRRPTEMVMGKVKGGYALYSHEGHHRLNKKPKSKAAIRKQEAAIEISKARRRASGGAGGKKGAKKTKI